MPRSTEDDTAKAEGSDDVDPLARLVVERLAGRRQTLAGCESLTGGLVGAAITAVPGASAVYRGGLITYATDLKASLAGVPAGQLRHDGAVAAATAVAMARGAARACRADWGLATTGVAGPDPQEGHPVGTVFVAVSGPGDRSVVDRLALSGARSEIRRATVAAVLGRLADLLDELLDELPDELSAT